MSTHTIRELGIPVRSVNRAELYAGRQPDGRPAIIGTMSQQAAGFFLLVIDPETGAFEQLQCDDPNANYTTAAYMTRSGRLYIGAAHTGDLYRYDPDSAALERLGPINPEGAIFPCRIDEDSTGGIWISSYSTADLTHYDPDAGDFMRYGRMDEVDMYAYCYVNTDDTVACLIRQTRPHVVVLDPETGTKTPVGPIVPKGEGALSLHRAVDRKLYITSSQGDYLVEGTRAVPVAEAPPEQEVTPALPDGSTFRYTDASEHEHRTLEVRPADGPPRVFRLDYQAAGTDIFCLHGGPDGCVYGSSVLPEHLFRYDPDSKVSVDLGVCSESVGEAYSMASLDGLIYIASYPAARLSVYDPERPYRFGTDPEANPRDLGRIDDISYRPRSALAGPGGRVWVASVPDYGMWGGPLSYYDPSSGAKRSFKRICGDASCYTLAWLSGSGLIAVGTTIRGGTGTQPRVDRAGLFLFDPASERTVWEGAPDTRTIGCTSLLSDGGEALIGVFETEEGDRLFRFDAADRRFVAVEPAPAGGMVDNGLVRAPSDEVYALTRSGVHTVDPGSLDSRPIAAFGAPAADRQVALGPVVEGTLYFSVGHRLKGVDLG